MSHYLPTPAQSRKGGRSRSLAKRRAQAALAAARRGVRVNGEGYTRRELEVTLSRVMSLIREPEPGVRSVRALAAHLGVSDRTVRRWLSGEDWPTAVMLKRVKEWSK